MKICFETASFILREIILTEKAGTPGCEIRKIRLFSPEIPIKENTLYIVDPEKSGGCRKSLFSSDSRRDHAASFLFAGTDSHAGENISYPDTLPYSGLTPFDNYAVCKGSLCGEQILSMLEDGIEFLCRWDSDFTKKLLTENDSRKLFELGKEILPHRYGIYDTDMRVLYDTAQWVEKSINSYPADMDDFFRELIFNRDFHSFTEENDIFREYVEYTDLWHICFNLTRDGEYIARLVLVLEKGETDIHPGEKEIFKCFAAHIQDVFTYGSFSIGRHSNDRMHRILKASASGNDGLAENINAGLADYGWRENQLYTVMVLHFYEEAGWSFMPETTLPFLAAQFERQWPNSCAVVSENEIILLINQSCEGGGYDRQRFLQKTAGFIRDNVCRAGISPDFDRINLFACAVKLARAALTLGSEKDPHFWYHSFNDLRLLYMVNQCMSAADPELVISPVIKKLKSYDESHRSALNLTLKACLENHLNMSAAAACLYIHKTTFMRRMEKIKELTGINLDNPDSVLELSLSYKISDCLDALRPAAGP